MLQKYRLLNNIGGWLAFAIALVVYTLTVEPTASFWDCGEFIASSYKMEVGHPPGAPLFMVVARFFSLFGRIVVKDNRDTKATLLKTVIVSEGVPEITGADQSNFQLRFYLENTL